MIEQIVPVFFTLNIPATLAYYTEKLGFEVLGTWSGSDDPNHPPVYAIIARDHQSIHFRCFAPPTPNPEKYSEELLDAYLQVEDTDALFAEFSSRGVEITRPLANMPWNCREFVIKDCDSRLLAFGYPL
jgi:uncharacterized glyoxalase superfamily protein PhnB